MFKIIKQNDTTIDINKVTFVKKQQNEVIVSCSEAEAMGCVKEDGNGYYQLSGRPFLGDFDIVTIIKASHEINEMLNFLMIKTLEDDYQMTTLKLGLGIDI